MIISRASEDLKFMFVVFFGELAGRRPAQSLTHASENESSLSGRKHDLSIVPEGALLSPE